VAPYRGAESGDMTYPQPIEEERFTYGDYVQWTDGLRWELIDGVPKQMTPGPSTGHQRVSHSFAGQLYAQLKGRRCEAFEAPFDVRLPDDDEANDEIRTVVQPDIVIYCDPSKIDERGGRGAPDFVVEILSPHDSPSDRETKLRLYERHGVKEFWTVDPKKRTMVARLLGPDGRWGDALSYGASGVAPIRAVPGVTIDLAELFARV
jgi:Uma2 family endonuclease